ncbi:MAG: DUF58 domain-containing protein [Nanoarchaeota archaeon]|nr:DUF58 domain-containing protein [Nanoarchaeota archaeon]
MAIKELHLNLEDHRHGVEVRGRRELLSRAVEGNWATIFKGRGMEFTGFRSYTFSDDASLIDWKATLRAKQTLIREYEEFKNFNVVFLLDVSNSMLFSTGKKFKAEFGAELVYSLSQAAFDGGDAIGLGMFSDHLVSHIQPSFGSGIKSQFELMLSNKEYYGGEKNFKKSLLEMDSTLRERSIIVLVSDFLGMEKDWEKYISMLSHRHMVVGIMIRDTRDRELPRGGGQFFLKDPNTSETMYVDASDFAKQYKELTLENEEYIKRVFKKVRSGCLLMLNEDDDPRLIKQFFASLLVK